MTLNSPLQQSTVDGTISGSINGSNRTFVLSLSPIVTLDLWWNGDLLLNGLDYTLSGSTVTLLTTYAPSGTDSLSARVWQQ